MSTFVLYHGNCTDGFGAAWAAWRALGDRATYVPLTHGEPPPSLPQGATVVMVDFAYPRDVILAMKASVGDLTILDHHKTAREDLAGLEFAVFDLDKSGAVLAWEYWHPEEPPPPLLRYVQDRDLWRWELPRSREVSAALGSHPNDFAVWSGLEIEALALDGTAILRFQRIQVERVCDLARMGDISGHSVPIVNSASFTSDVGEALLGRYPESPFAAIYFDDAKGGRRWSLRSRGDFDVSAVAREHGGGGHPAASGYADPVA